MKKIKLILLIVITILLSSCYNDRNPDGSYIIHTDGYYPYGQVCSVTLIDENGEKCEYILYDHGITHKGNCKYCKERKDKEKGQ